MPQHIMIAAFVLGSVLLLVALLGGRFKIFGAEVEGVTPPAVRGVAGVAGVGLVLVGLYSAFQPAPGPAPPPGRTGGPAVQPAANVGPITVRCSSNPFVIQAGEATELVVHAISARNTPIADADVTVTAGGGLFLSSNSLTVMGRTGYDGSFRTMWRAPNPAAPGYGLDLSVAKSGYPTAESSCDVRVR